MGLARVAVHIKMVVVGRSEVVTMADAPAVRGKVDRCAVGDWISSLSPKNFRFSPVLPFHSGGPSPYVTVYDSSRRISVSEQRPQRRANFGRRHPTPPGFSQDRRRQGSGLRILKIPIPQPATSCDFFPQNEPSRRSTILGSLLGRPSLKSAV